MSEIISKDEAIREYRKLTRRKRLPGDLPSESEIRFLEAETEAEAMSLQHACPDSHSASRRKQDGGGFEVAIYEKPETREEGMQIRSRLRSRWGSLH